MPDELRKPTLNQIHRDFILEGLARNHRPQRIVNDLQSEFGVLTTRQNVQGYVKRNPEIIQTLRAIFIESLGGCALIDKAERIAELEKMYEKFLENCAGNYCQENIKVLSDLIAQIQKEVEPIKLKGEGFGGDTNIFNLRAGLSPELRETESRKLRSVIEVLRNGNRTSGTPPVVSRFEDSSDN